MKARSFCFSGVHLIGLVMTGIIALALLAGPARSEAATEPFKIDFDQSSMQVGMLSDLPLGETASTAKLEGTIDENGQVRIPKANFTLPEMGITDPVNVRVAMAIESDATGTFNRKTGELLLDARAGVWISFNMPELLTALEGMGVDLDGQLGGLGSYIGIIGDLTCGFSPMDVTFTTGETSLGSGQPFTKGLLGPGALTAEWSKLGPFAGKTKILGLIDACALLKSYAPTLLEGLVGGSLPEGVDLGDLDLAALLANLDNLDLGPSSLTLTRTLDENLPDVKPPVTRPKLKLISPKQRKVKAGKQTRLKVQVKNTGNGVAKKVMLCTRPRGPVKVKGKRCRSLGKIKAKSTRGLRFKVKAPRGKKARKAIVRFVVRSANDSPRRNSSRILIRR